MKLSKYHSSFEDKLDSDDMIVQNNQVSDSFYAGLPSVLLNSAASRTVVGTRLDILKFLLILNLLDESTVTP